ncbi:GrpB family protein [Sporolactobacillus pectinivorans]|uniref:GrpB family protein n=1 Tax=Sporolactobacillus pectinivorans TaxID=1591408 RepID=UPI00139038F6|nr:GrpB family protein [Sporolactobacillus pectinivorans]
MYIEVVDHSDEWEQQYINESNQIMVILRNELINIFHIGSTSVPGLKAKPIIDMMPVF